MSAEKRLALCFVLSMLVMLGFNYYYAKKYPPEERTTTQTEQEPDSKTIRRPTPRDQETTPKPPTEPEDIPEDGQEAPESQGAWDWLASDLVQDSTEEATEDTIRVESELYSVVLSKRGGVPLQWLLLQYNELYEEERLLELIASRPSHPDYEQALMELEWKELHETNGNPAVSALDPNYDAGKKGLIVHWGGKYSDIDIPYKTESEEYQVSDEPVEVPFTYEKNGITLEKILRFHPDSYQIDMLIRLQNQSGQTLTFGDRDYYDVMWKAGFGFPSLRTDAQNNYHIYGVESGIDTKPTETLRSEARNNARRLIDDYEIPTLPVRNETIGWVGVGQKYFLASIIPDFATKFAMKGFSSPQGYMGSIIKPHVGLRVNLRDIKDGNSSTMQYTVYVGPLDDENVSKVHSSLEDARYMFLRSFTGPISNFMLRLLQGFYNVIPNYGVAIILLTLLIKVLMLPLYHKQMKSMKKMQALQPQLNDLKEKYKDDPQKMQKEQMQLFRKHKVNPLSGCLTMLPTIPIFIALYATFGMALELRGATFFAWIQDLSAPDSAFYLPLGDYIFTVNILPLAYAALMLWSTSQQKIEGPNATMMKILPLIFVVFFWSIASGVILYFVISIFIDVCQRLLLEKFQTQELTPAEVKKS